jgi:hypothetical protein
LNVYFKLSNDLRLLLARKLLNQGFLVIMLKSSFQMFYVVTMTWVTVKEYLCHKWPRIWSVCRNHNPVLSSSWLITRYVVERTTWLTRSVNNRKTVKTVMTLTWLVHAFLKKWWVESDFKAPNLPLYMSVLHNVENGRFLTWNPIVYLFINDLTELFERENTRLWTFIFPAQYR